MGLMEHDWRAIAEWQARLAAAASIDSFLRTVHGAATSLAEFDVSAVSITVDSLSEKGPGANRIIATSGSISTWQVHAYDSYYSRRMTNDVTVIARDGEGLIPLVECGRISHEFIDDYIVPMGIRRYYGMVLSLGPGQGFLSFACNCGRGSAVSLFRSRERLTALRPFLERLATLHGRLSVAEGERRSPSTDRHFARLSAREAQVADLLSQRLSAREIAGRLGITRRTAENHALHVYQKLGVCSRAELIALLLA